MCHKSPAKTLRNVIRMTKFLEKKPELLTINPLPSVNIIPNRKLFQFSQPVITTYPPKQTIISISHGVVSMSIKPLEVTKMPSKKPLSVSNICTTDIPPDPYPCMYCMLVAPRPNYPSTPTSQVPMCCVCKRSVGDRFEPQYCCEEIMHQHCWGEHHCIGWN